MDNAKYHSEAEEKKPTKNALKQEMVDFLTAKGIKIPDPVPIKDILYGSVINFFFCRFKF